MATESIIGKRFSNLIVIEKISGTRKYVCKCDCGNITNVFRYNITSGHTKSCGCSRSGHPIKDISGQRFGMLTAISVDHERNCKHTIWKCLCDCGRTAYVNTSSLSTGHTKSCGCIKINAIKVAQTKHGHTKRHGSKKISSPEFRIWSGIKSRCLNKNNQAYKRYGGRGITVCKEWEKSFEVFLSDMGERPSPSHSIDRVDNNGPYSKENCVWATKTEQANNKRNNRMIVLDGVSKSASDWARETGINPSTLIARINSGWSAKDAITKPLRKKATQIAALHDALSLEIA